MNRPVNPYRGITILGVAVLLLFVLSPLMTWTKPHANFLNMRNPSQVWAGLADWNKLVRQLGGIKVKLDEAQVQIAEYRAQTGQEEPDLPEVAQQAAPKVEAGQEPPQVKPNTRVVSYPPETYKSSTAFIDARFTGFEKLHEGWGFNEGLGFQCVAGTKWYIMSALGINLKGFYPEDPNKLLLFAPSVPNPGYPGPAFDDFKTKWNWVNNPKGGQPSDSILPPQGVANIDGKKIKYHTEIIDDVNALQRGDIVIFDIHVGEFSAYTPGGKLLLFDQNGTASMDPFTHHAFAKSNFRGAIRVVYHL